MRSFAKKYINLKKIKQILLKVFSKKDYCSGDGMLTTVWGFFQVCGIIFIQ